MAYSFITYSFEYLKEDYYGVIEDFNKKALINKREGFKISEEIDYRFTLDDNNLPYYLEQLYFKHTAKSDTVKNKIDWEEAFCRCFDEAFDIIENWLCTYLKDDLLEIYFVALGYQIFHFSNEMEQKNIVGYSFAEANLRHVVSIDDLYNDIAETLLNLFQKKVVEEKGIEWVLRFSNEEIFKHKKISNLKVEQISKERDNYFITDNKAIFINYLEKLRAYNETKAYENLLLQSKEQIVNETGNTKIQTKELSTLSSKDSSETNHANVVLNVEENNIVKIEKCISPYLFDKNEEEKFENLLRKGQKPDKPIVLKKDSICATDLIRLLFYLCSEQSGKIIKSKPKLTKDFLLNFCSGSNKGNETKFDSIGFSMKNIEKCFNKMHDRNKTKIEIDMLNRSSFDLSIFDN